MTKGPVYAKSPDFSKKKHDPESANKASVSGQKLEKTPF